MRQLQARPDELCRLGQKEELVSRVTLIFHEAL
jgi:hypothetical protein